MLLLGLEYIVLKICSVLIFIIDNNFLDINIPTKRIGVNIVNFVE